jgi:hypothetical protein
MGSAWFLRELLLERLLCVVGQPDLQQVPWRRRMVAAHHHDIGEQLLERLGQLRVLCRRAADHAAQEPARAVNPHKPDRLQLPATPLPARMQPRLQLDAERALGLLAVATRFCHLLGELLAYFVPQPTGFGRGKGHQLDGAIAAPDRDPDAHPLGHLDLDVDARLHGDEQTAEIYPVTLREAPGTVPRP